MLRRKAEYQARASGPAARAAKRVPLANLLIHPVPGRPMRFERCGPLGASLTRLHRAGASPDTHARLDDPDPHWEAENPSVSPGEHHASTAPFVAVAEADERLDDVTTVLDAGDV